MTRVVLGTSYRAEVFLEYFGDGSRFGLRARVRRPRTSRWAPAARSGNVAPCTRARPGRPRPDLQRRHPVRAGHRRPGGALTEDDGADVSLHLTRVDDPRAFGLVPTDDDGRVTAFLEKPQTAEEIVTDQINAGCYVFRRSVIDTIPAGRPVSVERETFPGLLRRGRPSPGMVDERYWLDLGTPLAFVAGSADLGAGTRPEPCLPGKVGQYLVRPGAEIADDAVLRGGTFVGAGATVGSGAVVDGSSLFDGAMVAAGAFVRDSVIGTGAIVGSGAHLDGVVVGDRAVIGPGNELVRGARVWPGVALGETAVRFSSDR